MRWIADPSEASVREAVAAAVPPLADAAIELSSTIVTSNPEWCAGTAIVDGSFIVKFAWSKPAAIRVHREGAVLEAVARAAPDLPIPRLVGASGDPVAFVTQLVGGVPLRFDDVRSFTQEECQTVGGQVGSFLALLHEPLVWEEVRERVPALLKPEPQGNTPALRERLPRFLDQSRTKLVLGWCDWVDEILSGSSPEPVFAHGDLHGFNQVWDRNTWTLCLVADFEVAGPADPEYDLRYFPSQGPTLALVDAIRERYTALSGRSIDMNRVMAWHIRTALGDALWRSEAGIALPGGGTPASYVDDLERKLHRLGAAVSGADNES